MHLSQGHLSAVISALMAALALSGVVRGSDAAVRLPAAADDAVVLRQRLSDYVQMFYARAQHVLSVERVVMQPLDHGLQPQGRARRLEYELRVSWQPQADGTPADAVVQRQLLKVDGRTPRPGDEPGCMDPRAVSPEPLAVLLPAHLHEYVFTWGRTGRVDRRRVRALDYRAAARAAAPTMTWRDDCVTVDAPGKTVGRVWVDIETGAVLRLEERLLGQIDVPLPPAQRRSTTVRSMSIERADTTIRYKVMKFADPPEDITLPVSIDSVTVIRDAGTPRLRTTQTFSNYRRFVTGTRVLD